MTRISARRGALIAAAVAVTALLIWAAVSAVSGSSPLDSAADDGYLGLRWFLEQRGATVRDVDADDITRRSVGEFDVVFVPESHQVDRRQLGEWHQYVAAGGRLVLGQPDRVRPDGGATDLPAVVEPGICTLDGGDTLEAVHRGTATGHHVHAGERSCLGSDTWALVTSAVCRRGVQFTLSSPSLFDNRTMGAPTRERLTPQRRGNAALAHLVLLPADDVTVAFVTSGVNRNFGDDGPAANEPRCADTESDDALWQTPTPGGTRAGGSGGDRTDGTGGDRSGRPGDPSGTTPGDPSGTTPGDRNSQGDPSDGQTPSGGTGGQGDSSGQGGERGTENGDGSGTETKPPPSLFDFLSPGLKLALAQLLAVLVWYAWRRSRRRGVVVSDEMPVELRSSRNVEAVGALRRRGGELERTAAELRTRTTGQLGRALNLGRDPSVAHVAAAVHRAGGPDTETVTALLDGPAPATEDELVTLTEQLHRLRASVDPSVRAGAPPR